MRRSRGKRAQSGRGGSTPSVFATSLSDSTDARCVWVCNASSKARDAKRAVRRSSGGSEDAAQQRSAQVGEHGATDSHSLRSIRSVFFVSGL